MVINSGKHYTDEDFAPNYLYDVRRPKMRGDEIYTQGQFRDAAEAREQIREVVDVLDVNSFFQTK